MPHRPLSRWVTPVTLSPAGVARWDWNREVNDGDERADARVLPEFGDGWQRLAVPVDLGYDALGLVRETARSAVLELDNLAVPVRVTPAGANVIARIEDAWPDAEVPRADAAVLASEEIVVRYLLLSRLAAEGQPPAELFHILPWDLVDRLADELTAALGGIQQHPLTALRHWFTPAGSRFTAAMEQLDEGLREQDPGLIRVAATSLCARVADADAARLPASTRRALAALITALRERNDFLGFTAARAIRRLADGSTAGQLAAGLRLETRLPAAADDEPGIRREYRDATREPFALQLAVTATGRAEVSLRAAVSADTAASLAGSYGVMLQPVTVTGAAGTARYLVPLSAEGGELSGLLSLPVPQGEFVEADVDGPPIGAAEARFLDAAEVERSMRAVTTRSDMALWERLAAMLPPAHPLRAVIARETE